MDKRHRHKRIKQSLLIVASLALPALPSSVVLAENSNDVEMERVIVTGSRIKASNTTSPIPAQIFGLEDVQAAGTSDLGEALTEIPGVYIDRSPQDSILDTQNAGLSVINLRNLGANRTLTLINGHRVVSNSGDAQRVDTGSIPTGFVKRIDITTGGASAIYGSDAIAGVANIVLIDDFEGFKFGSRLGDSDEGGDKQERINVLAGLNFANDRGNIMFGADYDTNDEVTGADRDYATPTLEVKSDGTLKVNQSSSIPGGRFEVGDAWNIDGVWYNDTDQCRDDGRQPACDDYQEALDGYNFRPENWNSPSRERYAVSLKANYEFSDQLAGYVSYALSSINTKALRAPANSLDSHRFGTGPISERPRIGELRNDHPFIVPEVRSTLSGTVDWRRRWTEVGQRFRESDRDTTRIYAGLDGDINESWSWSAFVGYGHHIQDQVRQNEVNRQKISLALDIEALAAGGFQCVDAAARADGCVPLNIFGVGSVSTEAANYIRATDDLHQDLRQTTASFVVNGELFEFSGGPMKIAFGVDYRRERQQTIGDDETEAGLTTTGFVPSFSSDYNVKELFTEIQVPLVADRPGIKSLDLGAAFRIAEYSTIDRVSSWNIGLSYMPIDDFRFRGQISQSQRAPDAGELNQPLASDFDGFDDPCDGVSLNNVSLNPATYDNCRLDPAIAAELVDPEGNGTFEQDGGSIFAPTQGNKNLIEETADTFTIGFVYTPQMVAGLTLIVDYYDIEIEDAIDVVTSQQTADLCYASPSFPNNVFCDVITRDLVGDADIIQLIKTNENLNTINSSGVDVTVDYDFELSFIPGELSAKVLYAYVKKNDRVFTGPDGVAQVDERRNETGLPIHEYRATLGWSYDGLSVKYKANYQGTAVDDPNLDRSNPIFKTIPIEVTHDLYASYSFGNSHQYRLYAGVRNIGDSHGPYYPDGDKNGSNSNVASAYDKIGRRFYTGLSFTW